MPRKVFDLASELGIGALDLVEKLRNYGLTVRNHMASLSDDEIEKAMAFLKEGDKAAKGAKKKTAKKKVAKKAKKKVTKKTTDETPKPEVEEPKENVNKVVTVRRRGVVRKKVASSTSTEATPPSEEMQSTDHDVQTEIVAEKVEKAQVMATAPNEDTALEVEAPTTLASEIQQTSPEELQGEMLEVESPQEETITSNTPAQEAGEDKAASKGPSLKMGLTPIKPKATTQSEEDFPKLRGLQIVYRPPANKEPEEELSANDEVSEASKSVHPSDKKKNKEYLEEKMHSFTPVYIPPKKAKEAEDKSATKKSAAAKGVPGASKHGVDDKAVGDLDAAGKDGRTESRKRMGGLAAAMSKPQKTNKAREVVQIRADEELKSYSLGGPIGKIIYTNAGKKKVYVGPSKDTIITEVKESKRVINVHQGCTAQELALKLKVKFDELKDKCLDINLLINPDDYLGVGLIQEITGLYRFRVEDKAFNEEKVLGQAEIKEAKNLKERAPIVTVMGHVDHGKTTLLDAVRKTKIALGEAGGITQHLGAYTVSQGGHSITFIDTPGHAAFAAMRERGAKITDIVVLVVAADDGVMPQTKESIKYCKQHDVPIIVAINKIDKEGANIDRIKQELMEFELTPEDWGGETQYVLISALKGEGIDSLLEGINLQAEIMELKGLATGKAAGVILESKIEAGRGPMSTVLVQSGTLKKGDVIVAGEVYGKARSLMDMYGKQQKQIGPSTAVQVLGLSGTPGPGDEFHVVKTDREAKKIIENRIQERKELDNVPKKIHSLEDFFKTQAEEGEKKILNVIIRTDVAGSYEAVKNAVETLGNNEVGVKVIAGGTGAITESDIQLADSSDGHVLAFNSAATTTARRLAETKGVEIRSYRVIYELINDVKMALEGMLDPIVEEKYIGRAEVRETFVIPKIGTIAGSAVVDGKIERGCSMRLLRQGKIVFDGKLLSLKRFKDDVKEVKNGYECGISLENYDNIKVDDIFEAYILEPKKRTLEESNQYTL